MKIKELDEIPAASMWGKVKKSFGGKLAVSVRGDLDVDHPDTLDLDVRINGYGTALQLIGQAGRYRSSLSFQYR